MKMGMEIEQERALEIGEILPRRFSERHDWNLNLKTQMPAQIDQKRYPQIG